MASLNSDRSSLRMVLPFLGHIDPFLLVGSHPSQLPPNPLFSRNCPGRGKYLDKLQWTWAPMPERAFNCCKCITRTQAFQLCLQMFPCCRGAATGLQVCVKVPSANARSQTQQLVIMCSAVDLLLLMRQQHDEDYSLWSKFEVAHKHSQTLLKWRSCLCFGCFGVLISMEVMMMGWSNDGDNLPSPSS